MNPLPQIYGTWIGQKMKCFVTWFGFSHSSWSWATHCSGLAAHRSKIASLQSTCLVRWPGRKQLKINLCIPVEEHPPDLAPCSLFQVVCVFLLLLNSPKSVKHLSSFYFLLAQKCPFLHGSWDTIVIIHQKSTNPCSTIRNSLLRTKTNCCSCFSTLFSVSVGWSQDLLREQNKTSIYFFQSRERKCN